MVRGLIKTHRDFFVRGLTMPPHIPISSLLDSDCSASALRDIQPHVTLVAGLLSRPTPLSVLPEIEDCLSHVIEYFRLLNLEPSQHPPVLQSHEPRLTNNDMSSWAESFTRNTVPLAIQHNVKLNRQMTLATLYIYDDINAYLEYPETSITQPVGYLFLVTLITGRIQLGALHIHSENRQGKQERGKKLCVLCLQWRMEARSHVSKVTTHVRYRRFFQCNMSQMHLGQGVKACSISDLESMRAVHLSASREDVKARLRQDRQQHINTMSPTQDIFEKTLAFISALQLNGCRAPLYEPTILSVREQEIHSAFAAHKAHMQRGYTPVNKICEGQLHLLYTAEDAPYIQYVKTSLPI